MKIYYTFKDGGHIIYFPEKIERKEAVKELRRNRIKHITGEFSSSLCGWNVHSVFFTENNNVTHIWDSTLNKYRPQKYIKGLKIPTNLKQ